MKDGIWLITSSAFVDQELSAEFGHLPPAFLPVGTKRLYEYQLERLGRERPVFITVPESYEIPSEDKRRLADAGATLLPVPDGLSLGEAVVFALNLIGAANHTIRILHGDTLIDDIPQGLDELGIAAGEEGYSWAEVRIDGSQIVGLETFAAGLSSSHSRQISCGYYSFSDTSSLIRDIVRARGDFIAGVLTYARDHSMAAVSVERWLDFGHLQTFFRSRRLLASARSFNTLRIDGRVVRKLSVDTSKMQAEADWFSNLPPALRVYTARLIDSGQDNGTAYYETEYEHLPTLSELFVFGTLSRASWMKILHSCSEFLSTCASITGPEPGRLALRQLAIVKTTDRLRRFAEETGFDVHRMLRFDGSPLPSLMQIAQDLETYVDLISDRPQTVMHGDLCFSNILYSSRVQRIRTIDPRGYVEPTLNTIMGDIRYDLAKLAHSIVGRYDQIIAGRYSITADDGGRFSIEFERSPHHAWLEDGWNQIEVNGIRVSSPEIRAITVGLFLSMLPLHADRPDRQRAFIANALRLYAGLETQRA